MRQSQLFALMELFLQYLKMGIGKSFQIAKELQLPELGLRDLCSQVRGNRCICNDQR